LGSIRASTSPFFTWLLKSTSTSVTWPEIWLPTVTVEIALRVPVEEIATRMPPRSTAVVRHAPSAPRSPPPPQCQAAAPASARTTTPAARGQRDRREAGRRFRLMGATLVTLTQLTHGAASG